MGLAALYFSLYDLRMGLFGLDSWTQEGGGMD